MTPIPIFSFVFSLQCLELKNFCLQIVGDRIGLRVGQLWKANPASVSATSGDTSR